VPSADAVKRTLRALATGTDTARPPCVGVIDEAEAALSDVRRAAGFVESVGLDGLAAAVEAAADRGDDRAAERGRTALAAYRRYRRVARPPASRESESDPGSNSGPGPDPDPCSEPESGPESDHAPTADQFHPGRGTTKSGDGEPRDE